MGSQAIMSPEEAKTWYNSHPYFFGCNFVISTASSQIPMFKHFDAKRTDEDLGFDEVAGIRRDIAFIRNQEKLLYGLVHGSSAFSPNKGLALG